MAVVANARRLDNGQEIPISRPGVAKTDIDAVTENWKTWAMMAPGIGSRRRVNLAEIRRRIHGAGLG